jgi:hypothetical protein
MSESTHFPTTLFSAFTMPSVGRDAARQTGYWLRAQEQMLARCESTMRILIDHRHQNLRQAIDTLRAMTASGDPAQIALLQQRYLAACMDRWSTDMSLLAETMLSACRDSVVMAEHAADDLGGVASGAPPRGHRAH